MASGCVPVKSQVVKSADPRCFMYDLHLSHFIGKCYFTINEVPTTGVLRMYPKTITHY